MSGEQAHDHAPERRADRLPGDVAHDPAAFDVLALGHVGRLEDAGGGADDEALGGEEVLAVVVVDGTGGGGRLDDGVERAGFGGGEDGGVGGGALGHPGEHRARAELEEAGDAVGDHAGSTVGCQRTGRR